MQSALLTLPRLAPKQLLPWLEHKSGPITSKLQEHSGEARLQLLQQSWKKTSYWDRQVLCLTDSQILEREILMSSGNINCWYAKTLIPKVCYEADEDFFKALDLVPLTQLVFNEPKVVRKQLIHYAISEDCIEFYWVRSWNYSKISPLWLRFSTFQFLETFNFYLIEVFLPDFIELIS